MVSPSLSVVCLVSPALSVTVVCLVSPALSVTVVCLVSPTTAFGCGVVGGVCVVVVVVVVVGIPVSIRKTCP